MWKPMDPWLCVKEEDSKPYVEATDIRGIHWKSLSCGVSGRFVPAHLQRTSSKSVDERYEL